MAALEFRLLRWADWAGLGIQCRKVPYPQVRCQYLPDAVLWAFGMEGRGMVNGAAVKPPANGSYENEEMVKMQMHEVVRRHFRTEGGRPVWNGALWAAHESLVKKKRGVSPPAYPHAAGGHLGRGHTLYWWARKTRGAVGLRGLIHHAVGGSDALFARRRHYHDDRLQRADP